MLVNLINFAIFTEVKIRAHAALVSDTLNRAGSTTVTGDSVMHLRRLLSSPLAKVIHHQSLEGLRGVGLDLFLNNLYEI
jgi:hypothetical protein